MSAAAVKETTLLLVRHGETTWTRVGRIQGRADSPLHPDGAAQIRALAATLLPPDPEWPGGRACLLVSSPLRRAVDSARVLRASLGPAIRGARLAAPDPRLAELDFGAWEGLTQPEVKARWPELLRSWKRQPDTVRLPGGETLAEARDRWRDFLAHPPWAHPPWAHPPWAHRPWAHPSWAKDAPPALAIVVTHAAMIRIALLEAAGAALGGFRAVAVPVASAHRLRLAAGRAYPAAEAGPR